MPCPFCGGTKNAPQKAMPAGGRLSRAQLLAGAAVVGVGTAVGACSSDEPTPDPGTSSSSGGSPQPVYGAPADAGFDDDTDASSGGVQPAYGAPVDDAGGVQPAYGAPATDAGEL